MTWPSPYLEPIKERVSKKHKTRRLNPICNAELHLTKWSTLAFQALVGAFYEHGTSATSRRESRRPDELLIHFAIRKFRVFCDRRIDVPSIAVIDYVTSGICHLSDERNAHVLEWLTLCAADATYERLRDAQKGGKLRWARSSPYSATRDEARRVVEKARIAGMKSADFAAMAKICTDSAIPLWGIPAAFEDFLWRTKDFGAFDEMLSAWERRFSASRNILLDQSATKARFDELAIKLRATLSLVNMGPISTSLVRPQWLDERSALEMIAHYGLERMATARAFLVEVDECSSNLFAQHDVDSPDYSDKLFSAIAGVAVQSGGLLARQLLIEQRAISLIPRYIYEPLAARIKHASDAELQSAASQYSHDMVQTTLHETWHLITANWPGHGQMISDVRPSIGFNVSYSGHMALVAVHASSHGQKGFYHSGPAPEGAVLTVQEATTTHRTPADLAKVTCDAAIKLASAYFSERGFDETVGVVRTVLARERRNISSSVVAALLEIKGFSERELERITDARESLAESLALLEANGDVDARLRVRNALAGVILSDGNISLAVELYEKNLQEAIALLDSGSEWTTIYRSNLAYALWSAGRSREAIPHYNIVLAARVARHGVGAQVSIKSLIDLGISLLAAAYEDRASDVLQLGLMRAQVYLGFGSREARLASYWIQNLSLSHALRIWWADPLLALNELRHRIY